MHYFFANQIDRKTAQLDADESLHLSKVLRLKIGDTVGVLDGSGIIYEAEVSSVHAKAILVEIRGIHREAPVRPYRLHIAIAPTKMMERFEWFLEKAVEIGIDEISPILTERCERDVVKMPRMENVVKAAMKQSLNAKTPVMNEPIQFAAFLKRTKAQASFIAHCAEGSKELLPKVAMNERDVLVCIGPEGDFTLKEISLALESGFKAISLGDSRLRAETAGVVACAQVQTASLISKY
jgi:16S rRNA (uracil1498-N3)-methyltransferase